MIAYICKYTPIELIKAFGEDTYYIEPEVESYKKAEKLLHPNICSFAKAFLEYCLENDLQRLVLTNCCDSIKRVYDVLKDNVEFIEIIDIPRKNDLISQQFLYKQLIRLKNALAKYLNKEFDQEVFINEVNELILKKKDLNDFDVAVVGARMKKGLYDLIEDKKNIRFFNLTCSGERIFNGDFDFDKSLKGYAKVLLNLLPCMRMNISRNLLEFYKNRRIIYNTVNFCDFYSFEYAKIKDEVSCVKIETDYIKSKNEQSRTRLEAFLEKEGLDKKKVSKKSNKRGYILGLDSGSTSTNAVLMDTDKNIISFYSKNTGYDVVKTSKEVMSKVFDMAKIDFEDVLLIVSTGYGRVSIPFSDFAITEITSHAKGVHELFPSAKTIIDIGGQDSKVIKIDKDGNVLDFVMNDKCSAGTGRFLEYMARVLELDVKQLSDFIEYEEDLTISSMCTVFAESEVVSLIAQGKKRNDIIRAINKSVALKTVSLVNRIKGENDFVMTGGVAKNKGVVLELEKRLFNKLIIPFDPQIVGALGACIAGLEKI